MNISKINEELKQILEDVERENELADNKAKKRIFDRAIEGLQGLQEFIGAGTNPVDGRLDDETTEFYVKLSDIIEEIYSRSIAFEE